MCRQRSCTEYGGTWCAKDVLVRKSSASEYSYAHVGSATSDEVWDQQITPHCCSTRLVSRNDGRFLGIKYFKSVVSVRSIRVFSTEKFSVISAHRPRTSDRYTSRESRIKPHTMSNGKLAAGRKIVGRRIDEGSTILQRCLTNVGRDDHSLWDIALSRGCKYESDD